MRIVFMGTPEMAVASLEKILQSGYQVEAVVTAPDKPAGRGRKITAPAVKKFALEKEIMVLQPENLKSPVFIDRLRSVKPDVMVVVAFRMLPKEVWKLPSKGTFNLHASLLPQYRGAAPINRAIMNGETKTGVTTFFLDEKIDTGRIIAKREISIGDHETAGELHDRIKILGAALVVDTLEMIRKEKIETIDQEELIAQSQFEQLKKAPKIFKEDCKIDWQNDVKEVFNHIRGLNPYPGAFTEVYDTKGESFILKIFDCDYEYSSSTLSPGELVTDNKNYLKMACQNGFIDIKSLQAAGKKRMNTLEFLRGFTF